MNERGTALVATLSIALILLPLGAFVVLQCRTDLAIQRNLRTAVEALYAAEAGVAHAFAEIGPGTSFVQILAGPDGISGTGDDGSFPFSDGPPDGLAAGFRYEVRVESGGDGMVRLLSTALNTAGAARIVEALVARSPTPFSPAALHLQGDAVDFDLGSNFLLSGLDHRVDDTALAPTGSGPPLPGLSTSSENAERSARARLSAGWEARVVGAGGTASLAGLPAFDVQAYAVQINSHPSALTFPGLSSDGSVFLGTRAAPQISVVAGDCDVGGELSGAGILVVRGTLHVSGTLSFVGLVVAMGGVLFETSSQVAVTGGFWHGISADPRVHLLGEGAVVYSSAAFVDVDVAFPGLLPHGAVIAAWGEQL